MKKNIVQIIVYIGLILLAISLVWWQQTFGFRMDFIKCFAFSDGVCRVGAVGKVFGGAGYNPIVFWIGVVCLAAGFGLKKV